MPYLITLLAEENSEVQSTVHAAFAAISALHNIGGIEARKAMKVAENDADERVRALAKRAH